MKALPLAVTGSSTTIRYEKATLNHSSSRVAALGRSGNPGNHQPPSGTPPDQHPSIASLGPWAVCPRKGYHTARHAPSMMRVGWSSPGPSYRASSLGVQEQADGSDFDSDDAWDDDSHQDIEVEDYTWSGDRDLDTPEDIAPAATSDPILDLTRPSLISSSDMYRERLLNMAMHAVYHGQHSRYTMGKQALNTGLTQLMHADAGLKARTALGTLDAFSGFQPAAAALPPVPPRFCGPVCLADIPGKGWGLKVTEVTEPGDVLLISEPLAFLTGPIPAPPPAPTSLDITPDDQQQPASNDPREAHAQARKETASHVRKQLLKQLQELQERLPDHHPARQALVRLWRGIKRSSGAVAAVKQDAEQQQQQQQQASGQGRQLLFDLLTWRQLPARDATGVIVEQEGPLVPAQQLASAELRQVIRYNALLDQRSDEMLAALRGEQPVSVSGVWPELSLINHACVPNAVHVMVGGRVVVRAAVRLLPGDEVTINYLGLGALQPYKDRQRRLRSRWHFNCKCARCINDEAVQYQLGSSLQAIQEHVEHMRGIMHHLMSRHTLLHGASQHDNMVPQQQQQQQGSSSQQAPAMKPPIDLSRVIAKGSLRSPVSSRQQPVQGSELLPEELIENLKELENQAVELRDHLHTSVKLTPALVNTVGGVEQVLGGVYGLYDLIATLRELTQPGSHRSLLAQEACALSGAAVQAAHPVVAMRLAHLAVQAGERYGVSDRTTLKAQSRCVRAFIARYGQLPQEELQLVINTGIALFSTYSQSVSQGSAACFWDACKSVSPFKPPAWAAPAWQWDRKLIKPAPPPPSAAPQAALRGSHQQAPAPAPAVVADDAQEVLQALPIAAAQQSPATVLQNDRVRAPGTGAEASDAVGDEQGALPPDLDALLLSVLPGADAATTASLSAPLDQGNSFAGQQQQPAAAVPAPGRPARRSRSASAVSAAAALPPVPIPAGPLGKPVAAGRKGSRSKSKAAGSPEVVVVVEGAGPQTVQKRPRGRPRKVSQEPSVPATAAAAGQAATRASSPAVSLPVHSVNPTAADGAAVPKSAKRSSSRRSSRATVVPKAPGEDQPQQEPDAGQQAQPTQQAGVVKALWGDDDDEEEEVVQQQQSTAKPSRRQSSKGGSNWLDSWA